LAAQISFLPPTIPSSRRETGKGGCRKPTPKVAGAVAQYRPAVKLDPQLESAYYNRGLSLANRKMYDEAIVAYLKEQENNGDEYDIETTLAAPYRAN
jgi:tetratricopeptide (TPR) repeat protein